MRCDQTTRSWIPLIGCCLALLLAAPAATAKKPKKEPAAEKEHVVALFVVANDKPKEKILNAVAAELSEAPKSVGGLHLITSAKLKKAIGKSPDSAITKCGADVKCIAKLGKSAKAELVVYARVSPQGAGVSVQILVVGVSSQIIEKKLSFEIAATGEVKNAIVSRLGDIFPAAAAPVMASADASGSDEIPLDAVLPTEPKPAAATVVADMASLDLVAPPPAPGMGQNPVLPPSVSGGGQASASTSGDAPTTIAAVAPEQTSPPPPPARSGRSRALTYAGIGVAGLGAAAAGAGGYFGMQSKSIKSSIKTGPTGTPQIQAQKKLDDANAAVGRANLMFMVGGGAVAVGAVLIAIDLATGPKEASTSVTVGVHPSGATLTWSF